MSANIAVSGIQAINTQLNVISGNIANANTVGYKARRANFASMMNGTRIGSFSQNVDREGMSTMTNDPLNAAIDGKGFFVLRDNDGSLLYSRNGSFSVGEGGYIVDLSGRRVQGLQAGLLSDLMVPVGDMTPKASTALDFAANLNYDWAAPDLAFDPDKADSYNYRSTSTVYDSLGNEHVLTQYFVMQKGDDKSVTVHYRIDGKDEVKPESTVLSFNKEGMLTGPVAPIDLDLGTPAAAQPLAVALNYADTTRFGAKESIARNSDNGYASGKFVKVKLNENGDLIAEYSNRQSRTIGTIALANFMNPNGLQFEADTAFSATTSSGNALYGTPGAAGKLQTGAVEGSNVELTAELVDLMTAQRNYQANAKVLTADAQMSQALMQAL